MGLTYLVGSEDAWATYDFFYNAGLCREEEALGNDQIARADARQAWSIEPDRSLMLMIYALIGIE